MDQFDFDDYARDWNHARTYLLEVLDRQGLDYPGLQNLKSAMIELLLDKPNPWDDSSASSQHVALEQVIKVKEYEDVSSQRMRSLSLKNAQLKQLLQRRSCTNGEQREMIEHSINKLRGDLADLESVSSP